MYCFRKCFVNNCSKQLQGEDLVMTGPKQTMPNITIANYFKFVSYMYIRKFINYYWTRNFTRIEHAFSMSMYRMKCTKCLDHFEAAIMAAESIRNGNNINI